MIIQANFQSTRADSPLLCIKLTDPSKLHDSDWKHKVELEDGIKTMYEWYLNDK